MPRFSLRHFYPCPEWELDELGRAWGDREKDRGKIPRICPFPEGKPYYTIDLTTNDHYCNEPRELTKCKCVALSLATPALHPIVAMANLIYRIASVTLFAPLWLHTDIPLKMRWEKWSCDLCRIFGTPFALIGLECAAFVGCANPFAGKKLYSSMERALYGRPVLAPCFQPKEFWTEEDDDTKHVG